MKKNFKLLMLTLIMGGGLFASEAMALDKIGDVYQIGTADQLIEFAGIVNDGETTAKAVLTADIDMSGKTWAKIGSDNDGKRFCGQFNGQGHRIKNLTISGNNDRVGFFGCVKNGTIQNLIIDSSCSVSGNSYVAALIGCCNKTDNDNDGGWLIQIKNIGIECTVTGTGTNVSAFVGCNFNRSIQIQMSDCYNTGAISGNNDSAIFSGWFGNNDDTRVTNCWNNGKVTGQDGNNSLGRGIGSNQFVNTYDLNSENSRITETILSNYSSEWITNGSLKNQMGDSWFAGTSHPIPFVDPQGKSVANGYLQLSNADDLIWFSSYVNNCAPFAFAQLTGNIDMTGKGWTPIGQNLKDFAGHFDGQNHRIKNLDLSGNLESYSNQALFGQVVGSAVIENVIMDASCTIKGNGSVAGILGTVWGDGATIQNCTNEATIESKGNGVGGIVGSTHKKVIIKNCTNKGSIKGAEHVGGILGYVDDGPETAISNCTNETNATIEATTKHAGGIVGTTNKKITISSCTNKGEIKGPVTIAGIIARSWGSSGSIISGCKNEGTITCTGNEAGGIMGASNVGLTVTNCINDGTISGKEKTGGIFGVCFGEVVIEYCINKNVVNGTNRTAGILGSNEYSGLIVRNCGNEGNITGTGLNAAGIVGCSTTKVSIMRCYNTGAIKGEKENASICAWMGADDSTLDNCYNIGTVENTGTDSDNNGTNTLWRYNKDLPSHDNNFYLVIIREEQSATKIGDGWLTSGELCYKLNVNTDAWHQTIGTDAYPVPFSTDHLTVSESDGDYYNTLLEVADASELVTFANDYNSGSLTNGYYKVCLTGDIDFNGVNGFPGIGTNDNRFRGIFDGQGHIISKLTMSMPNENAVGFFRYVTSGGTVIKRFTIDSSCSFTGNDGVGAFVGRAEGRNGDRSLLFEELGNEANVTANGANGGGILGVDQGSDALITVKNCYNTGTIVGNRESGAFSGWFGDNLKIYNCYNMGTIDQYQGSGLARANMSNNQVICENTYVIQNNTGGNHVVVGNDFVKNTNDFQNGTVFTSLFAYENPNNNVDGSVWRMYFDANDPTKSHPVLNGKAIAMREDCQNRMVAGTYDVKLYRTIKAGTWNTFCAPFIITSNKFAELFGQNAKVTELTSSDGDILHFTTVNGDIVAGKAYLVKTDNAISEINASNVTVSPTITPSTAGDYDFTGVYSPTSLPQDAYVFTTRKSDGEDVIVKVYQGTNMNGFRAYLKATSSSNARATSFVIDEDGTTGIITATGDVIENGKMYNLGGQRVNEPQRGLYIVNGKKYIK